MINTRILTEQIVEEVRNTFVSAGFTFEVTPDEGADTKGSDVTVAIMDANEELSQREYPGYVKKVAMNIDGSITLEFVVEEEECQHERKMYRKIEHTMHHHREHFLCLDCQKTIDIEKLIGECDCDVDMSPNHPNTHGKTAAR